MECGNNFLKERWLKQNYATYKSLCEVTNVLQDAYGSVFDTHCKINSLRCSHHED